MKTLEEEFPISNYPLEQTEFLFYSKEGRFTIMAEQFAIHLMRFVRYKLYSMTTECSIGVLIGQIVSK